VAVPTPGAVGGFHLAYQIAVQSFFGVPDDRAVGAAIVLHAISFVPVTLLGIAFMAQEGLTFGSVRQIAGDAKDTSHAPGDLDASALARPEFGKSGVGARSK
jgi:hypothetical protein